MTEYFSEEGAVIPVTVVLAGPVTVTRVFEKSKDGYNAVQVGFGAQKKQRITKARAGQMRGGLYRTLKEFRLKPTDKNNAKEGDVVDVSIFAPGDKLQISGISKGKGFQGVVKRHGFHGGPRSHGQKHSEREPGSIGATWPQRVIKGKRMAGRMGGERTTTKSLKILKVEPDKNLIFVSGPVPGRRGTLVEVVKI